MQSTHISTERLEIIDFSPAFISDQYVSWLNDGAVVQFSEQRHRVHTKSSCRAYFDECVTSGHMMKAICAKPLNGQHIGNMTVYVDSYNQLAELSILIGDQAVWGQGYGFEAWNAMLKYLLNLKDIRKVCAGTLEINNAMVMIMQKSGMQGDGCRKAHYLVNSQEVDLLYFSKMKN